MIRKYLIISLLTVLFVMIGDHQTAKATTVRYFISVEIPAIPGFNVFSDGTTLRNHMARNTDQGYDQFDEVEIRENRTFLVQTIVPR
ncbi:MAG: hypothetical protein KBD53_04220 [Candidatus Omnitrophica bacterium]|nr:hypothetical protein [Candidatus Omnitrophota bacterium]